MTTAKTTACPRCNGTGYYSIGVCYRCHGRTTVKAYKPSPKFNLGAMGKDGVWVAEIGVVSAKSEAAALAKAVAMLSRGNGYIPESAKVTMEQA